MDLLVWDFKFPRESNLDCFFFFFKYCFVTKCQILEEKKYIYQGIIFDKPKFNKFKKSL